MHCADTFALCSVLCGGTAGITLTVPAEHDATKPGQSYQSYPESAVPAAPDAPQRDSKEGAGKAEADSTPEQNSSEGGGARGTVPARSQDAGELKELVDSLDRVHLFRAKLGFVGRGRSGKTSTFNALKRNVRFDEHERSTIAAECNTLENALHREDVQEWIP